MCYTTLNDPEFTSAFQCGHFSLLAAEQLYLTRDIRASVFMQTHA